MDDGRRLDFGDNIDWLAECGGCFIFSHSCDDRRLWFMESFTASIRAEPHRAFFFISAGDWFGDCLVGFGRASECLADDGQFGLTARFGHQFMGCAWVELGFSSNSFVTN